jgi:hypothetical protein
MFDSFEFSYAGERGGHHDNHSRSRSDLPPEDLSALLDLSRFLELHTEPALLLGPDGEQAPLPEEVYRILVKVVDALREGKVITVVPRTQRLTTQEAADFLGISRPTLVKLLEQGKFLTSSQGGTAGFFSPTSFITLSDEVKSGMRLWIG